jgi:hypothetical protein
MYSSQSLMPSWRYFQTLFSSEEQKTIRSSDFRALIPFERCESTNQFTSPSWRYAPPEFSLLKQDAKLPSQYPPALQLLKLQIRPKP